MNVFCVSPFFYLRLDEKSFSLVLWFQLVSFLKVNFVYRDFHIHFFCCCLFTLNIQNVFKIYFFPQTQFPPQICIFCLQQITRPSQEEKSEDKNEEDKAEKSERKEDEEKKDEEEKDEKEDSR